MMRVVHHTWSFDFGGIERLVLDLATQQRNTGNLDVAIHVGKGGGRQIELLAESGIPYEVAGLRGGADLSPARLLRMREHFRKFDILHLHSFTPLVALAAWLSGKKIVYTEHGNFAFGRRRTLTDRINGFLLKFFLRQCVSFISYNSEFTAKEARHRYEPGNVRQQVIYNGIPEWKEPGSLPEEYLHQLKGLFVVGTSSRLAGFKRIDRLVKAFAIFAAKKPDACLLIVGDGPHRENLERQVTEAGMRHRVHFTGYSPRPRDFQSAMHVCVFPSEGEPFGIAALETLSLGKPTVVMKDGGGLLEIIAPLEPQDVVKDVDMLATRLEHYYSIRDVDTRHRDRIEHAKKFDIAVMEQAFDKVYSELLS